MTLEILGKCFETSLQYHFSDLQLLAMFTLAHDGLLRGSELCNLKLADLQWTTREQTAFVLLIHKSKCNKTGPPEEIYLQQYAAPHGLCAASVLREYLAQIQMRFGCNLQTLPTSTPLFPLDWVSPAKSLPKRIFVDKMRVMLERAGIPASNYTGHSFRSGGTTDLYYANCRPFIIQRLGRWKSDAWHIYIRDRPSIQREEVAEAYARAASHLL